MSIQYKTKLILSAVIAALYVAMYLIDRGGYVERLSSLQAQAVSYALVLVGGIVIGVTAEYLRQAWMQRRGRSSRTEEHAA